MKFLDKQINDARNNYNYFFIKLIFLIFKNIFKLSVILLLSNVFNYTLINIIAIISTIYYSYNIISIINYYMNIIKDIKDTLGEDKLYFEIDLSLLYCNFFKGVIRYGK